MQNVSPMLAKKISNQNSASNNQSQTVSVKSTPMPNDSIELSKKDFKKKILIGTGILATLATAGILIYNSIRKGKPEQDVLPDLSEGVKRFIDANGKIAANVELKNGKAIDADGMFTGIMETLNKKGQKITLEYKDGYISSSKINDELFKKFDNVKIYCNSSEEVLPRAKGVSIISRNEDGYLFEDFRTEITYFENGKAKRICTPDYAKDFYPDGKIAAEERMENSKLIHVTAFDKNGKITWESENDHGAYPLKITKYLEGGLKKVIDPGKSGMDRSCRRGMSISAEEKMQGYKTLKPHAVMIENKEGETLKTLMEDGHNGFALFSETDGALSLHCGGGQHINNMQYTKTLPDGTSVSAFFRHDKGEKPELQFAKCEDKKNLQNIETTNEMLIKLRDIVKNTLEELRKENMMTKDNADNYGHNLLDYLNSLIS